mgnify:FL=1
MHKYKKQHGRFLYIKTTMLFLYLHRCRKECGIAKDVEDVFACRHKECFALAHLNAVDVSFSP